MTLTLLPMLQGGVDNFWKVLIFTTHSSLLGDDSSVKSHPDVDVASSSILTGL